MLTYIRNYLHPLWRLRQSAWFRRLQPQIDFIVFRKVGKIQVALYWLRDLRYILALDDVEQATGRQFEVLLREFKPTFFLDVGANIGIYSWKAANLTEQLKIWTFEPDERNIELLKRTISRNGLKRVTLHAAAVSDTNGMIPFLVDNASGTTGSLENHSSNRGSLHHAYGMKATRNVTCVNLDSFADELAGQRVLLKIDVEGAEDRVLHGARRLLNEIRPLILIECFDFRKVEWLSEAGYQIHDLKEEKNYVAYPREMAESINRMLKSD